MKNLLALFISLLLFFVPSESVSSSGEGSVTVTVLYDNYLFSKGLVSDWGFSCLVEGMEKNILFDTGTKGDILFHNINKLNVNPKNIDYVVLSHHHGDHTGGLFSFLKRNSEVSVYFPVSFPDTFVQEVEKAKARAVKVDNPVEICRNVFLTGEMGTAIREQAMILKTNKGLIIITGCSHPGIVDIIKKAKEIVGKEVYTVFGGFHLLRKSDAELNTIISQFRNLGVLKVGATHCTGDRAIELFKKEYDENFIQMGVGRVLKF